MLYLLSVHVGVNDSRRRCLRNMWARVFDQLFRLSLLLCCSRFRALALTLSLSRSRSHALTLSLSLSRSHALIFLALTLSRAH
eukprot:1752312-Pleurochrysis_carterae.AAC.1